MDLLHKICDTVTDKEYVMTLLSRELHPTICCVMAGDRGVHWNFPEIDDSRESDNINLELLKEDICRGDLILYHINSEYADEEKDS